MSNYFATALVALVLAYCVATSLVKGTTDKPREKILRAILKNPPAGKEWITMETLSRAVAADEAETARLLFQIGARRSTGDRNVWALKSRKPL